MSVSTLWTVHKFFILDSSSALYLVPFLTFLLWQASPKYLSLPGAWDGLVPNFVSTFLMESPEFNSSPASFLSLNS